PYHRSFEARARLAAGGYRAATPGEARSGAWQLQDLARLRERAAVRRFDVRAGARGPLSAPCDDGADAAGCDPPCDRRLADRGRGGSPGADGLGRFALGRSDDVGNARHADRADADRGDAGRRDLSAGIGAALAATLAPDADHAQPPGAAGG